MSDVLIFGGTTEGRLLAEFCAEYEISADICVTTDFGANLLPKSKYINIMTGRKNRDEIDEILQKRRYTAVIDATHPYAAEITENIKSVCTGIKYLRIKRNEIKLSGLIFDNLSEIITLCNNSSGSILSTMGCKECHEITTIKNFKERVWIRILPIEANFRQCIEAGFPKEHIIAENPPFSLEKNISDIRLCNAEILLTKESGSAGGYSEKAKAAEICGIRLVTLKRPPDEGISLDEVKKLLLTGG
ncbi:MAG: precorrin-6A reductase [Ruminococcus sp.]|nr:precorrin-6A reductase [Ruminococcus sp.]